MPVNTSPQSPPKRMTRARAKAVEQTQKAPSRSTKITTPAAKAAITARTAKRKDRTDEDELQAEAPANRSPPPPQPSTRTAATGPGSKAKPITAASTRNSGTAASRARAAATAASVTKPTRARPKTDPNDARKPQEEAQSTETAPPARSTRTRAASVTTKAPTAKPGAGKKKVTFQDADDDKENAAVVDLPKGRATASNTKASLNQKSAGIKAKPVRRMATKVPAAATRRGQAVQTPSQSEEPIVEPLSPKKNVQVSVPSAADNDGHDGSENTLTPTRQLNKSPKKMPSSVHRTPVASTVKSMQEPSQTIQDNQEDLTSIDELQGSAALFTSPTKPNSAFTISSPPKRPPQSPFKGSMMDSPRRKATVVSALGAEETDLNLSHSVVAQPPKRFPMSEPRKKVTFDSSSDATMTGSLLKSPAKRPLSPSKGSILGSTVQAPATTSAMRVMTSSVLHASPRRLLFSPTKQATSSLKAMRSPEASAKVHKMTPEEQAKMFEDEVACGPSPYSPMKQTQRPVSPLSSKQRSKIPVRSPPTSPPQLKRVSIGLASPPQEPVTISSPSIDCLMDSPELVASPQPETQESASPIRVEVDTEDCESEDELQAPVSTLNFSTHREVESESTDVAPPATPAALRSLTADRGEPTESMTLLAERFSGWHGATPDSNILEMRKVERSMFSPLHPIVDGPEDIPSSPDDSYFGDVSHYGGQTITVHADEDEQMVDPEEQYGHDNFFRQSHISDASQEYGDENAIPIDPTLLEAAKAPVATCTPARVFGGGRPQVIHTVCKVPLKPAADYDESPVGKPARRTHSLSAELSPNAAFEVEALRQIYPLAASVPSESTRSAEPRISKFSEQLAEDGVDSIPNLMVSTPSSKSTAWSAVATPARTPRHNLNPKLLSGAVVFVDVHTTEGADANGIFVELLTQMGARCVKQWNWNPRNSVAAEVGAGDLEGLGGSKVGITHVVFKDGGKRTMERVREAKGLVLCVGVGWVLDCERENKWLDEAGYAIDVSTIPRGGHRRRKSMEPKALSNASFSPVKPVQPEVLSPTKEFLNLSSPTSRRATIASPELPERFVSLAAEPQPSEDFVPATPAPAAPLPGMESVETPPFVSGYADSSFGSPTTPYFLDPQQLVQQTCPPKQSQQSFFPLSGRIEDEPDERVRQRLLVARRKSLQWAPRVGSPLARAHSFQ